MPREGDAVKSLTAQKIDEWELQPGEVAIVVEVDKDGDFKLKNPSGTVSGWAFRKKFAYHQACRPQNATDGRLCLR